MFYLFFLIKKDYWIGIIFFFLVTTDASAKWMWWYSSTVVLRLKLMQPEEFLESLMSMGLVLPAKKKNCLCKS